ncbi:MAG TPA: preprotein translocase subunit SecE [Mycobacteriales bacterium]|nr:preprotein translocase subunit SecE [Mycobacteriales bacterium]
MTQTREGAPAAAGSGRGKGGARPGYPERFANYNRQVVAELRKVIWPTRNELVTYTIVSVVFVTILIVYIGLLDYGFTKTVFEIFS